MLREYQLQNFKAFSGPETLPIRPLTFIYGPNSAGKSSVIQSLMLLKQTLEESENFDSVLLPKGELVDLGSFRELIHLHDIERELSMRFQVETDSSQLQDLDSIETASDVIPRIYKFLYNQLLNHSYISLKLSFRLNSETLNVYLASVDFWLGEDEVPVITFARNNGRLVVRKLHVDHQFWQYWWSQYENILKNRFFSHLNSLLKGEEIREIKRRDKDDAVLELNSRRAEAKIDLKKAKAHHDSSKAQENAVEEKLNKAKEALSLLSASQVNSDEYRENGEGIEESLKEIELEGLSVKENGLNILIFDRSKGTVLYEMIDLSDEALPSVFSGTCLSALLSYVDYLKVKRSITSHQENEKLPLKEQIAKIEREFQEAIKAAKSDFDQIDQCRKKINVLEWLSEFCERLDDYTSEKALEDYQKALQNIEIDTANFLINKTVEAITEVGDYDFTKQNFEYEFWSNIYEGTEVFDLLLDDAFHASDLIREILNNYVYLGPTRDHPERFYVFSGQSSKKVGKTGQGTSDLLFKNPDYLKRVNDTLKEFELGYEIKISSFQDLESSELSDIYAIRLFDQCLGVSVSPLDVGFGVSQILPVIVQSVFASSQTILIEQPEVHIHPRLQTALGSLLVRSVDELGNRFIIETHSEHLMLRIQKLIRNGKLNHEDVSVIYVDRDKEGSRCLSLRLDAEGDFIDEWPGGFFEEGFEEIF